MSVILAAVDASALDEIAGALGEIYAAAFGEAPYYEPLSSAPRFVEMLQRHAERSDFRCIVACEGDVPVGFAYGYTGAPGQWWHDLVARSLGAERAQLWLSDAFEVVDLAVHPRWQGRGIGRRLHDTLLTGLPHRTAVLSTRGDETPALHLYRTSGWVTVEDDFRFPGLDARWLILGRQPAALGAIPSR